MILLDDILTSPTLGLIYTASYKDYYGITTEINIYKKDYSGTSSELTLADPPLLISQIGNGDDITAAIRGSEATLNIVSQNNFEFYNLLFNNGNYDLKLEIVKNDSLFWSGWIISDIYQESLTTPPFVVTLKAVDGLALLANYDFYYDGTENRPYEVNSFLVILAWVLSRTRLELDIEDATNLYPDTFTSDSPLADIWINTQCLWSKNLVEVLEFLLTPHYRICQDSGRWVIYRCSNITKLHDSEIYTYDLGSSTTASDNNRVYSLVPIGEAGANKCTIIDESAILSYDGVVSKLTLQRLDNLKENITGRSRFDNDEWNGVELVDWTETGGQPIFSYYKDTDDVTGNLCMCLRDTSPGNAYFYGMYSATAYEIADVNQLLKLTVSYRFEGVGLFSSGCEYYNYIMIKIGDYYLTNNGTWSYLIVERLRWLREGYGFFTKTFTSIEPFPTTGYIEIILYCSREEPLPLQSPSLNEIITWWDSAFLILTQLVKTNRAIENVKLYEGGRIDTEYTLNTETKANKNIQYNWWQKIPINQQLVDYRLIWDNWVSTSGTEIAGFSELKTGTVFLTMELLLRNYYSQQLRFPRMKLTGSFIGQLSFASCLSDKWLSYRKLAVNSLELNDKYSVWNGEFVEVVENYFFIRVRQGVGNFNAITLYGTAGKEIYINWGDGSTEIAILTGGSDVIPHSFTDGDWNIGLTGELEGLLLINIEDNQVFEIFYESIPQNLHYFYCDDNLLKTFDLSLIPLYLEDLFLSNNQITEVIGSCKGYNLNIIFLNNNLLTEFNLSNLSDTVQIVELSDNDITELTGVVPTALADLVFENNAVTLLEITGLANITHINAIGNAIAAFEPLLKELVDGGGTNGELELQGGTNQAYSSLSVQGQADHATLALRGWTISMN